MKMDSESHYRFPMAMEGKTAACAHLSPVGNIAAAACDTWSNESVQNLKLLGGMAPTCYVEQLIYDCRLMNQALADGRQAALLYQKWMVNSDASRDPQAWVLSPESAIAIAQSIVTAPGPYAAGKAAALTAVRLLGTHTRRSVSPCTRASCRGWTASRKPWRNCLPPRLISSAK